MNLFNHFKLLNFIKKLLCHFGFLGLFLVVTVELHVHLCFLYGLNHPQLCVYKYTSFISKSENTESSFIGKWNILKNEQISLSVNLCLVKTYIEVNISHILHTNFLSQSRKMDQVILNWKVQKHKTHEQHNYCKWIFVLQDMKF